MGVENGVAKSFDKVVMDIPIGSGPYRIGPVRFGKDITYVRDANYWARELNVKRGSHNFERITVKIYKDSTARLEALKAGEFDLMRFFPPAIGPGALPASVLTAENWSRPSSGTACPRDFRAMCSTPGAKGSRTPGCAKPWAWRSITSG